MNLSLEVRVGLMILVAVLLLATFAALLSPTSTNLKHECMSDGDVWACEYQIQDGACVERCHCLH